MATFLGGHAGRAVWAALAGKALCGGGVAFLPEPRADCFGGGDAGVAICGGTMPAEPRGRGSGVCGMVLAEPRGAGSGSHDDIDFDVDTALVVPAPDCDFFGGANGFSISVYRESVPQAAAEHVGVEEAPDLEPELWVDPVFWAFGAGEPSPPIRSARRHAANGLDEFGRGPAGSLEREETGGPDVFACPTGIRGGLSGLCLESDDPPHFFFLSGLAPHADEAEAYTSSSCVRVSAILRLAAALLSVAVFGNGLQYTSVPASFSACLAAIVVCRDLSSLSLLESTSWSVPVILAGSAEWPVPVVLADSAEPSVPVLLAGSDSAEPPVPVLFAGERRPTFFHSSSLIIPDPNLLQQRSVTTASSPISPVSIIWVSRTRPSAEVESTSPWAEEGLVEIACN